TSPPLPCPPTPCPPGLPSHSPLPPHPCPPGLPPTPSHLPCPLDFPPCPPPRALQASPPRPPTPCPPSSPPRPSPPRRPSREAGNPRPPLARGEPPPSVTASTSAPGGGACPLPPRPPPPPPAAAGAPAPGSRPDRRARGRLGAGRARAGRRAIVPDFFVGQEPWHPSGDWSTFPEWLKTRDARKIDKEVDAVLKYLKQQCHAQKIGIVGFCWGGVAVHHVMMKYPEFRAGVSVYGIIKDSEDVHSLKNPTLFIFAENDAVIPLEQVSLLTQKLKKHCKVEYQIKTFSGQTHGFVHRKREDCSAEDKPYIDEARRNLIEWLHKPQMS
uniref:Carboxymethylenebutenolidase homolog n=1 Tax=Canis lupus familiaris TaxID=9615 RepID=A0A8C0TJN4_CANLF